MAAPRRRWILTVTLMAAVGLGLTLIGLRARSGDFALRIRLARAVNEGRGQPIDMNNMAAFTWDSFAVLGPGTPNQVARDLGALPWHVRLLVGLSRRDDVCVLAFKLAGDHRTHVVLPRKDITCGPAINGRSFGKDNAVFDVRPDGDAFTLLPRQG